MKSHTLRRLSLLLALGWACFIYYLSSQPGQNVPPLFFGQDKLFHFIAFGILGFFSMGAAKADTQGYRHVQMLLTIVLVTLYGVLDEFHQYFVPGRVADHYDVMADMVGAIFGVWALYYLLTKRHNKI